VQVDIPVIIDQTAPGVPSGTLATLEEAGLFGNFGEGTVCIVVIEDILAPVGDEQILETVVIVISDAHSLAPARAAKARPCRNIRERPVAVVVVEVVSWLAAFGETLQSGRIDSEYIRPPVVVVVEEGDPATRCLNDPALPVFLATNADRIQARVSSDID